MILEIDPIPPVVLSGDLGAPGDLDGRSVILEVAGLGETGVLRVEGSRSVALWFDRGRPVFGKAEGLVGLDGRLEADLPAERFAEAERRTDAGSSLADELAANGVPSDRLRDELKALVLDVLRILVVATGPYEFAVCGHRYTGVAWVDLVQGARNEEPERTAEVEPPPPSRPEPEKRSRAVSRRAVPKPSPRPHRVDVPLVAQSMPEGVLAVQLDPSQWVVALALAEPRSERGVADRTGLTERAVAEAVERLRRAGLVTDALAVLNDAPAAVVRNPITGRRAHEPKLILADEDA